MLPLTLWTCWLCIQNFSFSPGFPDKIDESCESCLMQMISSKYGKSMDDVFQVQCFIEPKTPSKLPSSRSISQIIDEEVHQFDSGSIPFQQMFISPRLTRFTLRDEILRLEEVLLSENGMFRGFLTNAGDWVIYDKDKNLIKRWKFAPKKKSKDFHLKLEVHSLDFYMELDVKNRSFGYVGGFTLGPCWECYLKLTDERGDLIVVRGNDEFTNMTKFSLTT